MVDTVAIVSTPTGSRRGKLEYAASWASLLRAAASWVEAVFGVLPGLLHFRGLLEMCVLTMHARTRFICCPLGQGQTKASRSPSCLWRTVKRDGQLSWQLLEAAAGAV